MPFDIPFLARRMIINQIPFRQTQFIWQNMGDSTFGYFRVMAGDYKHYTSLKLMCKVLGIPL
jgi:hypothetical protein